MAQAFHGKEPTRGRFALGTRLLGLGLAGDDADDALGVFAILLEIDVPDIFPVAKYYDVIADFEDLPKTMRGEIDGNAPCDECSQETEQALHLRLFQRRCRLVEDEQLRLRGYGLCNLDDLHLAGARAETVFPMSSPGRS